MRYFIKLAYCGTKFNGWQSQMEGKGARTVQTVLGQSLTTLTNEKISLVGCGRTDTGVHANDYYAHVDCGFDLLKKDFVFRLNKLLPPDIAIENIFAVKDDAHARFDAESRSYIYKLHTKKSVFSPYSFHYRYGTPDLSILNGAAKLLLEFKDFNTFCKANTDVRTTLCDLKKSEWFQISDFEYEYHVTSDRFLRGMIRLIVGMCLNVARQKLTLKEVRQAISEKRRTNHDWSVPAEGLFLCNIQYPKDIFL